MKKQIRTSNFIGPAIRICILIIFTACVYLGTKIKNNYKDSASSIPAPTDVSATEESIFEDSSLEEESCKVPSVSKDPYVQLETIFNKSDMWEGRTFDHHGEEVTYSGWDYAITDFDCDGKLEVLVSGYAGNGVYSLNRVFEYESEDNLIEWDMKGLGIPDSEPDFILQHNLRSEYDEPDTIVNISNTSEYIALDEEVWGIYGRRINYIKFEAKDNSFSSELIAYYEEYNPDDTITYYNSESEIISKSEFDEIVNEAYWDEENLKTFGWLGGFETIEDFYCSYEIWMGEFDISYDSIVSSYVPSLVSSEEKDNMDAYSYSIEGPDFDTDVTCDVTSLIYGYDVSNYNGIISVTRKPNGKYYTEFIFYEDDKEVFKSNNKEKIVVTSEGLQFYDINGDGKDEILVKYYDTNSVFERWVSEAYIYTETEEGWQLLMTYNCRNINANIAQLLETSGYDLTQATIEDINLVDDGVRVLLAQNFEKDADGVWNFDGYELIIK